MQEHEARTLMVRYGASLYMRGYIAGSAGNISIKLNDGTYLVTPTGSSLGFLEEEMLSHVDERGNLLQGLKPTKELFFHLACYETHRDIGAVVHLHATYTTLLASCEGVKIKPFTSYFVMNIKSIGLLPYRKPGSIAIADDIRENSMFETYLMANHGMIVCRRTVQEAVYAAEEFEEAAKLWYLSNSLSIRYLTDDEIAMLSHH